MPELPGQITTALDGGGLALSAARPVEEGARAALLLAPGLFRLDVCPQEDTLKITVRNLSPGPCGWSEGGRPLVMAFGDGPAVSTHTLDVEVTGRRAKVLISASRDEDRGVMHFVAQAEVTPAASLAADAPSPV